jgi:hypothetical protein
VILDQGVVEGSVVLKDLDGGEQVTTSIDQLADAIGLLAGKQGT